MAEPSACRLTTRRPGAPIAAPVASGMPSPIAPPVSCSQSCGAARVRARRRSRGRSVTPRRPRSRPRASAPPTRLRQPSGVGAPRPGSGRGPGSGTAARGAPSSSASASQRRRRVLLGPREDVHLGRRAGMAARLARIGEEADRRLGADQDQVLDARAAPRARGPSRRARARARPAAAARDAGVERLGAAAARRSRRRSRCGQRQRPLAQRLAAEQQQHVPLARRSAARGRLARRRAATPAARPARGSGAATTPPSSQDVSAGRISVATWPGDVRAACTAAAASAPDRPRPRRRAHPGGDAARPALGVGGQRRVERAVVGGLVADDVDDAACARGGRCAGWRGRCEARAAVQQRGGRLAGHAPVAVGAAGDDVLLQRRARSACPAMRSSAATKCISLVPGLAKQMSTPQPSSVRTRLSAPFILFPPVPGGGKPLSTRNGLTRQAGPRPPETADMRSRVARSVASHALATC